MKILFPVDNSPCVETTIKWATQFLNPEANEIYLLTVLYMTPEVPVTDFEVEDAERLLGSIKRQFETKGFKVAQTKYIIDVPATAICAYADEQGIDQIIMGSHGRQGLAQFLMGSVSQEVFKKAKQPVLVVKNTPEVSVEISHAHQVPLTQKL